MGARNSLKQKQNELEPVLHDQDKRTDSIPQDESGQGENSKASSVVVDKGCKSAKSGSRKKVTKKQLQSIYKTDKDRSTEVSGGSTQQEKFSR